MKTYGNQDASLPMNSLKPVSNSNNQVITTNKKNLIKQTAMILKTLKENCELIAIFAASVKTAKRKA